MVSITPKSLQTNSINGFPNEFVLLGSAEISFSGKYCLRKISINNILSPILLASSTQTAEVNPINVKPTLKLLTVGSGTGTVVINPLGLQCNGNSCSSVTYPYGTTVTLTANPDPGFNVLWGQDCSGNSIIQNLTLTADKSCTVRFYRKTTLNALMNVDNTFALYISTDNKVTGEYIGSGGAVEIHGNLVQPFLRYLLQELQTIFTSLLRIGMDLLAF